MLQLPSKLLFLTVAAPFMLQIRKMTIFYTLVTYNFSFLKLEKHPPVFHARFLTAEYRRFLPAKTLGMCYLYLTLKISMHGFDLT